MKSRAESVVNTLGATNIAKSVREDLDFYQTPSGATQALIDMDLLREARAVLIALNYDNDDFYERIEKLVKTKKRQKRT